MRFDLYPAHAYHSLFDCVNGMGACLLWALREERSASSIAPVDYCYTIDDTSKVAHRPRAPPATLGSKASTSPLHLHRAHDLVEQTLIGQLDPIHISTMCIIWVVYPLSKTSSMARSTIMTRLFRPPP